jgi:hypothetical protein
MAFSRFVLCLTLALPVTALAFQSIETETINTPEQGANGNVRAALDGRSGNTERQDYTVGGRINYRARETDMFVLVEHSRAKAGSQEIENNSWAHAGFIDEFQRGLAAEAFIDGKQDDFQTLDSRTQLGAGMRFTLDYTPNVRAVYAGIGVLHEWENQAGHDDHYSRLNSYVAYKRQINEQVRGLFNIYYQPSFEKGSDYLLSAEAAVLVRLATQLDLKVGAKYEYDGNAPLGIKPDDTRYVTAINFHF